MRKKVWVVSKAAVASKTSYERVVKEFAKTRELSALISRVEARYPHTEFVKLWADLFFILKIIFYDDEDSVIKTNLNQDLTAKFYLCLLSALIVSGEFQDLTMTELTTKTGEITQISQFDGWSKFAPYTGLVINAYYTNLISKS